MMINDLVPLHHQVEYYHRRRQHHHHRHHHCHHLHRHHGDYPDSVDLIPLHHQMELFVNLVVLCLRSRGQCEFLNIFVKITTYCSLYYHHIFMESGSPARAWTT